MATRTRAGTLFSMTVFSGGATATDGAWIENVRSDIFTQALSQEFADKRRQPLIKLGRFKNDSRASGAILESISGVELDYDSGPNMAETLKRLKAAGIAALVCESWSSSNGSKYRVLIPFSKLLPPDTRSSALQVLEKIAPGFSRETHDDLRCYFIGSPSGMPPRKFVQLPSLACLNDRFVLQSAKTKNTALHGASLLDHPLKAIQSEVKKLGHKLKDGEGRFALLQYAVGRWAYKYAGDVEKVMAEVDDCANRYFDAADVDDAARKSWGEYAARICKKEARKRESEPERVQPKEKTLPSDKEPINGHCVITLDQLLKTPPRKVEWLLKDSLPMPGAYLLASKPKGGKTYLAIQLALTAAHGGDFLGYKVPKMPALYWDCENGLNTMQRRLVAVMEQLKLAGSRNFTLHTIDGLDRPPRGDEAVDELVTRIEAMGKREAPKLVVIDTLAGFFEGGSGKGDVYQNDYDKLIRLQNIAHYYNAALVVLMHDKKRSRLDDNIMDKATGTRGLMGACEGLIFLERRDTLDEPPRKLAVLQAETRGALHELALGIELKDSRWHAIGSIAMIASAANRQEVQLALGGLQEDNEGRSAFSAAEIARYTGRKQSSTQQLLKRMLASGELALDARTKGYHVPVLDASDKGKRF